MEANLEASKWIKKKKTTPKNLNLRMTIFYVQSFGSVW